MTRKPFPTPPLAALLAVCVFAAVPARASNPWELLENLRTSLQKAGPTTARFIQTYIPAGFSSGDQESGHVSFWLPDCLRWNYEDPQSKNFLVCQGEVYFWTDDEPGGRHYRVRPEEEPGLDLLLLEVTRLRERYIASSEPRSDGGYTIALSQPEGGGGFSARIHLGPSLGRILGLEYTDGEGNLTRFDLADYQRLSHTALFKPPSDVEWTEE